MDRIDRRTFVTAAGGLLAGAGLAGASPAKEAGQAQAAQPPPAAAPARWKRAYMLGHVTKGPVLPTFQLLKEAGFEGVELISPNQLDMKEVLAAKEKTGLVIHGVSGGRHWQEPLSDPDALVVERGLLAIKQEIADCKAYGGTTVLVVPAVVNKKVSYREAYARSQEQIRKLIPVAEAAGVKLAIEEVWNKFLLSPPEFARYIDEFDSPVVGAYFDVGNVVEYGFPEEWIRELGKRILKIHVKEYGKSKRFDYRLGEGEIDWPAVRKALVDVGYDGWITAEVGFGDLAAMKDVVRRMNEVLQMA
ncbi:D-tagatose 3-epimerase [Aquisphaera giovannonii]|uniref:D-tagatose 3-epimerase n=1 Tax=Aquisphaera giovannonii TaxID=406548 RepID=A0A5B9VZK4_9BACT|nr:sugar phosphate isomerase/epimerase family protein [Aquisphaera giovannonii]QEH33374.1 D-tagatose 3-epimerase [Aquisphaera giovannonii]